MQQHGETVQQFWHALNGLATPAISARSPQHWVCICSFYSSLTKPLKKNDAENQKNQINPSNSRLPLKEKIDLKNVMERKMLIRQKHL